MLVTRMCQTQSSPVSFVASVITRGLQKYQTSEGACQFAYTKQTGEEILTNRDIEGLVVRSVL